MPAPKQVLWQPPLWNEKFLDAIKAAIVVHDSDTKIVACNKMAEELLGLSKDQMLGKAAIDPAWDFIDETGSSMPLEQYPVNQVLSSQKPLKDFIAGIRCPDKREPVWVLVNAEPSMDQDGTIFNVVITFMDITQRKRAEEELKRSGEMLRAIIEAAPTAIIGLDQEGNVHSVWNPAAEKMLGWSAQEVMGRPLPTVPAERQEEFRRFREQIRQGLTLDGVEVRRQRRDGSPIDYSIYASPLHDAEGRISGNVAVMVDITERKQNEEELKKYRYHLEELVNERTAELADAKETAEAFNKELEAFAYSVSHDLRAPLRHIDGFLKLLQEKAGAALEAQAQHYMDNISDAAQKMGRLIDDLLAFTRMGRHNISVQRVELAPLVREVIRELEPPAAGRNIVWHIGHLPAVNGDEAMLRMVLNHLVSNALKFTRPRPAARIEIGSLAEQDSNTVIFVRDNGVGFDMTYADKLFGVFQRLHRPDEFEGTGIGLANVRRIITRHGGRAWAEGAPDQGAAFYFSLPRTFQGGENE
jgi:PAS domain S-box-containing protein